MALTPADHLEIQTLYAKFNFALDMGPAEAAADCFTAEGTNHVRGVGHTGRKALVAFYKAVLDRPVKNRHWNNNLIIEEAQGGATGRAYVFVLRLNETPRPIAITGLYEDQLVRTAHGWKFSFRRVTFDDPG